LKYARNGEILLFIDPSSEHCAFAVATLKNGDFTITNCGMLYASSSWELGQKLYYIYQGLKLIIKHFSITHVITEDFVMPSFRQSGVSVLPTINNNLKMLAWELSLDEFKLTVEFISVSTWRHTLGISGEPALDKKGQLVLNKKGKPKKDFKVPTRRKVAELLKIELPVTILSCSNLKEKPLPHDITDCLAIACASAIGMHYPRVTSSPKMFKNEELLTKLYKMRKKV